MDWNKISVAHAMNPGLGLAEWNRQHKRDQKKNEVEYLLRRMDEGDKIKIGFVDVEKTKVTWKIRGTDFTSIYSAVERIMMLNGDNWV